MTAGPALEDGSYETLVVDAHADGGTVQLELVITTGPHKGEVVRVRGPSAGVDELDLLAAPATLVVTDGVPSVRLDPGTSG